MGHSHQPSAGWFHFSATGFQKNASYKFEIINMTKPSISFRRGMHLVITFSWCQRNDKCFVMWYEIGMQPLGKWLKDGGHWQRFGSVDYFANVYHKDKHVSLDPLQKSKSQEALQGLYASANSLSNSPMAYSYYYTLSMSFSFDDRLSNDHDTGELVHQEGVPFSMAYHFPYTWDDLQVFLFWLMNVRSKYFSRIFLVT